MHKKEFKPYVPAHKVTPEFTVTSIIMGVILAVVFGAANAYLGLRVGMTVSASIPAAVISMAVIRVILKKDSILESNMVQTIGSAGESLAAGAIFTLPALFLWAKEGVMDTPSIVEIAIISVVGGLLGVLFMVPLRNALIVNEHGVLPYPEGTACAEVLLAGESGGASAKSVFAGMGIAAVFKFLVDGLGVIAGAVAAGGIISLCKTLPLIITTFKDAIKGLKEEKVTTNLRTEHDLSMKVICIGVIAMIVLLWALPVIPVTLLGAIVIVVFGFFFATVSSRMVLQ